MGERGSRGACPSPAGSMHILGIVISFCVFLLGGLLILRGAVSGLIRLFPLFYSYIIYNFCGFIGMYLIYWRDPQLYPSAYWIYYLVSILVEFTVLVEISDQIFRPFPAIRNLGRALTIVISIALGFVYILPAILGSTPRRPALFDFALRACVTKAVILVVLFYVARHYGSELGRNVGGLMFGFAIYLAMNIAWLAAGKAFEPALRDPYSLGHGAPCLRAVCTGVDHIPLGTCTDAKHEYNFDGHGKRFRSCGSGTNSFQ